MVSLTAQRSSRRRKHASSATRREERASDDICAEHSWAGRQSAKLHMEGQRGQSLNCSLKSSKSLLSWRGKGVHKPGDNVDPLGSSQQGLTVPRAAVRKINSPAQR